jgi:hypothetical protein
VLREAAKVGAYDDMPMLPEDIQVQVHLSRNDRPQPFHQICAKDTLLFLLSGGGAVELKGTPVGRFAMKPGDCVYVPAGAPHRIVPDEESVILRYKSQPAGLEGLAWFCAGCGTELHCPDLEQRHRRVANNVCLEAPEAFAIAAGMGASPLHAERESIALDTLGQPTSQLVSAGVVARGKVSASAWRPQNKSPAGRSGVGCPPGECPWYSRGWEKSGMLSNKGRNDARSWTIHPRRS